MGPKFKPPKRLQTAVNADLKENKVQLGDTGGMKRALDDAVAEVGGGPAPKLAHMTEPCLCPSKIDGNHRSQIALQDALSVSAGAKSSKRGTSFIYTYGTSAGAQGSRVRV